MSFDLGQKIFVTGHRGMVGSSLVRKLHHELGDPLLPTSEVEKLRPIFDAIALREHVEDE